MKGEINMLDKEITLTGKFYLKSGVVIEDVVVFDVKSDLIEVQKTIKKLQGDIADFLKDESVSFQLSFGNTLFRGKDISAVTLTVKE